MLFKLYSPIPFELYKIKIYHCLPMYRFSRNKFFLWSLTVLLCYYIPDLWHFRDWLPLNLSGLMRVLPRTLLLITWGCLSEFSMFWSFSCCFFLIASRNIVFSVMFYILFHFGRLHYMTFGMLNLTVAHRLSEHFLMFIVPYFTCVEIAWQFQYTKNSFNLTSKEKIIQ